MLFLSSLAWLVSWLVRKVHVPANERVDSTRILTAEDFEKIKLLKRQVAMGECELQSRVFRSIVVGVAPRTDVTWAVAVSPGER